MKQRISQPEPVYHIAITPESEKELVDLHRAVMEYISAFQEVDELGKIHDAEVGEEIELCLQNAELISNGLPDEHYAHYSVWLDHKMNEFEGVHKAE